MISKPLLFVPLTALPCLFAFASCGSSSGSQPGVDAASDAVVEGAASDASPHDAQLQDGSVGCPASVPADGSPCAVSMQCEYGNFDWADCNATATCTLKGWSVAPPPSAICAPNNTMCPSASADVQRGGSCPAAGITCFYPDATCECGTAGADAQAIWTCDDAPSGCPSPRPHLGDPCGQEGLVCDYSSCGKAVHNIEQRCKDGFWRFVFTTCDGG